VGGAVLVAAPLHQRDPGRDDVQGEEGVGVDPGDGRDAGGFGGDLGGAVEVLDGGGEGARVGRAAVGGGGAGRSGDIPASAARGEGGQGQRGEHDGAARERSRHEEVLFSRHPRTGGEASLTLLRKATVPPFPDGGRGRRGGVRGESALGTALGGCANASQITPGSGVRRPQSSADSASSPSSSPAASRGSSSPSTPAWRYREMNSRAVSGP